MRAAKATLFSVDFLTKIKYHGFARRKTKKVSGASNVRKHIIEKIRRVFKMADFNNLKLEVADEIARLTITRPAALNALNSETLEELTVALDEIEARDDIKVVILTGGPDKKDNP